jgi:hypothetical protein
LPRRRQPLRGVSSSAMRRCKYRIELPSKGKLMAVPSPAFSRGPMAALSCENSNPLNHCAAITCDLLRQRAVAAAEVQMRSPGSASSGAKRFSVNRDKSSVLREVLRVPGCRSAHVQTTLSFHSYLEKQ